MCPVLQKQDPYPALSPRSPQGGRKYWERRAWGVEAPSGHRATQPRNRLLALLGELI